MHKMVLTPWQGITATGRGQENAGRLQANVIATQLPRFPTPDQHLLNTLHRARVLSPLEAPDRDSATGSSCLA